MKEEEGEEKKGRSLLGGLVAGLVAGTVAGLLLAPKAGKESRTYVRQKGQTLYQFIRGKVKKDRST